MNVDSASITNFLTYVRDEGGRDVSWYLHGEVGSLEEQAVLFELDVSVDVRQRLVGLLAALFGDDFFALQSDFELRNDKRPYSIMIMREEEEVFAFYSDIFRKHTSTHCS